MNPGSEKKSTAQNGERQSAGRMFNLFFSKAKGVSEVSEDPMGNIEKLDLKRQKF